MSKPAVDLNVCLGLIREYLSGYRGYPQSEAGENRFAFALQENVLSVAHARAVLKLFDQQFPTVREIHETAWSIRPQFEPKESQTAEWRRIYGEPKPLFDGPIEWNAFFWECCRNCIYYNEGPGRYEIPDPSIRERGEESFWLRSFKRNTERHPESLDDIREQALKYGWDALMAMTSSPDPFRYRRIDYRIRGMSSISQIAEKLPTQAPVTQADIDRAMAAKREQDARKEQEGWDDPDR